MPPLWKVIKFGTSQKQPQGQANKMSRTENVAYIA